jgi:hypothetical protein
VFDFFDILPNIVVVLKYTITFVDSYSSR